MTVRSMVVFAYGLALAGLVYPACAQVGTFGRQAWFTAVVVEPLPATTPTASPDGDVVSTQTQAETLCMKAHQDLAALGIIVPRSIPTQLRTVDQLNAELHSKGGPSLRALAFYEVYNPECIWMASGYSTSFTEGVLAHELTHAWLSTSAPRQNRELAEGFATWTQYHVWTAIGDQNDAAALKERTDPYGDGLRAMLKLETRVGVAGVVQYARTWHDALPSDSD